MRRRGGRRRLRSERGPACAFGMGMVGDGKKGRWGRAVVLGWDERGLRFTDLRVELAGISGGM